MKDNPRDWGIWLADQREWAVLSPRLCKPTPHNTDLCPALLDELRRLAEDGHSPELKRIPRDTLKAMKEQHRD